jgi:predicted O-methyltransferase YrrM
MTNDEEGVFLFLLVATQRIEGDVVEIGSWQGKSSSFIARAMEVSQNGTFWAVDHFQGNLESRDAYVVNRKDLGDLQSNFERNMESLNLSSFVEQLNMDVSIAASKLSHSKIRFLFVDGDHSYQGVKRDFNLFKNQLTSGAFVVFDDFSLARAGLVQAVNEIVSEMKPRIRIQFGKMLLVVLQ